MRMVVDGGGKPQYWPRAMVAYHAPWRQCLPCRPKAHAARGGDGAGEADTFSLCANVRQAVRPADRPLNPALRSGAISVSSAASPRA